MSRYYDDYLEHSGIVGMKWGIRRYQNEDGSLTEEGKIRYGVKAGKEYYKVHALSRKQNKTNSFKKYQKLNRKIEKHSEEKDRYESRINKEYVNLGRKKVATSKFYGASAKTVIGGVLGASATIAGAAIVATMSGGTVPVFYGAGAAIGSAIAAKKSDLNYYRKEASNYNKRAETPKQAGAYKYA